MPENKYYHAGEVGIKLIGYSLLLLVTIAGLWGIAKTLLEGHLDVATTQHVPWGLWVAGYIFFLGISAGSFLLSTLIYVFGARKLEPAGPLSLFQALLCLVLGGILIILDLGHPFRIPGLIISMNPSSVMAWMGFFYNLYILIILVELYFATRPELVRRAQQLNFLAPVYKVLSLRSKDLSQKALSRDRKWLMVLGIIGIPTAIIVHGGVGAIFAVAKARPNWFGGLFPILFLISALVSGGALLTLLTAIFSKLPRPEKLDLVRILARLTLGLLILDILLLASEVLVTLYGEIVHDEVGWRLTLFGPFWWVFWLVQIFAGMVIPLLLITIPRTGRSIFWLAVASFLMVSGIFGSRLNVVIPPLIQPAFDALPQAYFHQRFAWGYFPSTHEWIVALGVIALGIWIFLAANKLLPLSASSPTSPLHGGK